MIIVFPSGNRECSICYQPDLLSPEVKAGGIELAELPKPKKVAGKYAVLMGKKETKKVWYDYRDIPPDPLEARVEALEKKVALLESKGE